MRFSDMFVSPAGSSYHATQFLLSLLCVQNLQHWCQLQEAFGSARLGTDTGRGWEFRGPAARIKPGAGALWAGTKVGGAETADGSTGKGDLVSGMPGPGG